MARRSPRYSLDPLSYMATFDALSLEAQWLYLRLRLSPRMSPCGVVPRVRPRPMSTPAFGSTLLELEVAGYIRQDADTEEVWLVPWAIEENVAAHTNRLKAMRRAVDGVYSTDLRVAITAQLGELAQVERDATKRRKVPPGIRAQVFARDGLRCVSCGTADDLTVDHIVAVVNGGTNDLQNLQTMCQPCNSRKAAR